MGEVPSCVKLSLKLLVAKNMRYPEEPLVTIEKEFISLQIIEYVLSGKELFILSGNKFG
jgi:hypothetical protein